LNGGEKPTGFGLGCGGWGGGGVWGFGGGWFLFGVVWSERDAHRLLGGGEKAKLGTTPHPDPGVDRRLGVITLHATEKYW